MPIVGSTRKDDCVSNMSGILFFGHRLCVVARAIEPTPYHNQGLHSTARYDYVDDRDLSKYACGA